MGKKTFFFMAWFPKLIFGRAIVSSMPSEQREGQGFELFFFKVLQFDTEQVLVWYSYWKKDRNLTVKKQVRNYHKRLRETMWWHKTEQKENWANALEYKHCEEPQKKNTKWLSVVGISLRKRICNIKEKVSTNEIKGLTTQPKWVFLD